jgi:hypothetical protein
MLTKTDLIRLAHTPDLTEAGILYACQWLTRSSRNLGASPYGFLRRKIGQVTVELAFRRWLTECHIPFNTLKMEPFSDPHQHDLSLGGRRLHLNSYLLSKRDQVRSMQQDPAGLLQAAALVPHDQFVSAAQTGKDIYLFAFLLALTATSQADRRRLEVTENPHYFLAVLPKNWSRPDSWMPLRPLVLKSDSDLPVTVELGGLDAERNFSSIKILLQPRTRTIVSDEFYSLAYLHVLDHPKACLGIHSPILQPQAHILQPVEWSNLWVYGMDIWLTGWMSHDEYRRRSVLLPAGVHTTQFSRTRYKNLSLPMTDLHPVEELFEQVRSWQAGKTKVRE